MYTDRTLWIMQIVMGIYFIAIGVVHFVVPEGLPGMMAWMYDLDDNVHLFAGTAEILGGLGLILPGWLKIQPKLTTLAAEGLVLMMAGAIVYHISRGEYGNLATNVIIGAVVAVIAYGRGKKTPLTV